VFTELLPGNALNKSVAILMDSVNNIGFHKKNFLTIRPKDSAPWGSLCLMVTDVMFGALIDYKHSLPTDTA
jgi:hypothetical protein